MILTKEEKLKYVKAYKEGQTIPTPEGFESRRAFKNSLLNWVKRYNKEGEKGLDRKRPSARRRIPTVEEKLAAILPVLNGKISLKAQSKNLGIHDGTLCAWIRRYGDKGTHGLECSRKGRRPENMEQQAKNERRKAAEAEEESVDALKARIAVLEHTVLLQKAELEYRKKLHALAETRKGSGTSTRQGSSTNSAKARNSGDASGSRNGSPSQG